MKILSPVDEVLVDASSTSIAPAATSSYTSGAIDGLNAQRAVFVVVAYDPSAAGLLVGLTIQESANGSTGWTTVGTMSPTLVPAGGVPSNQSVQVELPKRKRYLRYLLSTSGTPNASCAVAVAVLLTQTRALPITQAISPTRL